MTSDDTDLGSRLDDAMDDLEEHAGERAQHVFFAHHILRSLVFAEPVRFLLNCIFAQKPLKSMLTVSECRDSFIGDFVPAQFLTFIGCLVP